MLTPPNQQRQTASFYAMGPKDTFHNAMALSKSAFDTAFRERIHNNNNPSLQHSLGEPVSKHGRPIKITAGGSFYDRLSTLSSKDPFLPLSKDGAEAQAAI